MQFYLSCLYRAIFAACYYGLLRIGQAVKGEHVLKAVDVHLARNKRKLKFVLHTSKTHTRSDPPQIIIISHQETQASTKHNQTNPCKIIGEYLDIRRGFRTKDEQFFVFSDRTPVTPAHVRSVLRTILREIGLNGSFYNCHSFRGGRASDLLQIYHLSVETIKKIGRW